MTTIPSDDEPTAVYRIFGADDLLLYIGMTKDFGNRWKAESSQMPWWTEVRRQTVEWFPTRDDARVAEAKAIRAERPRYNRRGVPVRLRYPGHSGADEWSNGDRELVIDHICELVMRADIPHAEFRLLVACLVTTGKVDLPVGTELTTLAHRCGVSRASAFRYRAEATERLAKQKSA